MHYHLVTFAILVVFISCNTRKPEKKDYMEIDNNPESEFVDVHKSTDLKIALIEPFPFTTDSIAHTTLMDISQEAGIDEMKSSEYKYMEPSNFPEEPKPTRK